MTLQGLAESGATVLVSSHILSELAEMCSSLCIMNQGRLLASGSAEHVRRELGKHDTTVTVTVINGVDKALEWLSGQEKVHDAKQEGSDVVFEFTGSDDDQADLLEGLIESGVRVKSFIQQASSFEDILVEVAEQNRIQ